jgi:hypothetical protein
VSRQRSDSNGEPALAGGWARAYPEVMTTRAGGTGDVLNPGFMRAALTVWVVVNAVNLLQAVGFATRPFAPDVNPLLGLVIAALAVPATWALATFVRQRAGWRHLAGPAAFDAFVALMLWVDHIARVEWRDPPAPVIEVPYLTLFFGSIFLMGLQMFRIDRRRWLVTVATTALLLAAMVYASAAGVG